MKLLKDIGEDRLVKDLSRRFSRPHPRLLRGIGDDASITTQRAGYALLATTDMLIEGTHFDLRYTPAFFLGKKALSISLSDIAAMGGSPMFYLVSIALPPRATKEFLDGLYRGLSASARGSGAVLAGGNTARTRGGVMVETTVLGEAPLDEVVFRTGARAGDGVYVTGTLGDSALGLKILKEAGRYDDKQKGAMKKAVLRHLDPAPRVAAGRLIAARRLASSMMDISDGLLLDLKRLCGQSGVGAAIELERLPLSNAVRLCAGHHEGAIMALSGGEDYELLFTAPPEAAKKLAALKGRAPGITRIGEIVARPKGVNVLDGRGKKVSVARAGFVHF